MRIVCGLNLFEPGEIPTLETARRWYENVRVEIDAQFLSVDEQAYLAEYYTAAGLLRSRRRRFFLNHFARAFSTAAAYLVGGRTGATIVDLGCGTGTQCLALALLGARVVAVDGDEMATQILRKRIRFYEAAAGRSLDIEVSTSDAFAFDFGSCAPIMGVWSLFAFNLMQPSSALLDRIFLHCGPGVRLAIQDGNRLSWRGHLPWWRRRVWSPVELDGALTLRGFRRDRLSGAAALPPIAWALLPEAVLRSIEVPLLGTWSLAISYLALYEHDAHGPPVVKA